MGNKYIQLKKPHRDTVAGHEYLVDLDQSWAIAFSLGAPLMYDGNPGIYTFHYVDVMRALNELQETRFQGVSYRVSEVEQDDKQRPCFVRIVASGDTSGQELNYYVGVGTVLDQENRITLYQIFPRQDPEIDNLVIWTNDTPPSQYDWRKIDLGNFHWALLSILYRNYYQRQ